MIRCEIGTFATYATPEYCAHKKKQIFANKNYKPNVPEETGRSPIAGSRLIDCEFGGTTIRATQEYCEHRKGEILPRREQPSIVAQEPNSDENQHPVSSSLTFQIQNALEQLGYDPGPIDGVIGEKTRRAVAKFQKDNDLPSSDRINEKLLGQLEFALSSRNRPVKKEPTYVAAPISSGTGFLVNTRYAVTNHHVVEDCLFVGIPRGDTMIRGSVDAFDREDDVALVQIEAPYTHAAKFRLSSQLLLGEPVFVAGFPLRGLLARDLNFVNGQVSALAGLGNDARYVQISAPIQPGNSGGPLLDDSGMVIGMIVGKLDTVSVAKITGDIPQNINFAIKAAVVKAFLDIHGIDYEASDAQGSPLGSAEVAAKAQSFTVPIECYQ